ncbi:hypothetical protein AB0M58_14150 [Streptomyces bobili]|uniref:hypothetical protein n=1 Tax=Streptomyces bobili TaxID=67280 RepID=UPI00343EF6C5
MAAEPLKPPHHERTAETCFLVECPDNKGAFDRFQPLPAAGPAIAMLRAVTELACQRGAQDRPARQEKPQVIRVFADESALAERLIAGESRSGKSLHHLFVPRRDTPETTS